MDYKDLQPSPSPESLPFWEGLLEKKLLIQQCSSCNLLRHYPRPMCHECYSLEYGWIQSKGEGAIHSWVTSYHPFHPAFTEKVPYITITANLTEGVRLLAPVKNIESGRNLELGGKVEVGFNVINPTLCLPYFKLS
ncbi:MAG: OB-fold domain-containing protein [Pseudomonadota bacterium]|nr:OB-fold domain-containing protein [Pseudomonadota bacterium]